MDFFSGPREIASCSREKHEFRRRTSAYQRRGTVCKLKKHTNYNFVTLKVSRKADFCPETCRVRNSFCQKCANRWMLFWLIFFDLDTDLSFGLQLQQYKSGGQPPKAIDDRPKENGQADDSLQQQNKVRSIACSTPTTIHCLMHRRCSYIHSASTLTLHTCVRVFGK